MKHLTQTEIKTIEQETGVKAQKCPTCKGHGAGFDSQITNNEEKIFCLNCQGMGVIFPDSPDEYWIQAEAKGKWKA